MRAFRSSRLLIAASLTASALAGGGVATAQSTSPDAPPPSFPVSALQPPVAPAADMQAVLNALQALGAKPIETLTPAEARRQPTPADATKAVIRAQGRDTPDADVTTQDFSYASDPMQKARVYFPPGADRGPRLPVVIYFHGGGWVIGDLNSYDATPRLLSKQMHALVVSIEYRHAPERRFPAQLADADYAYDWAVRMLHSWRGDRSKLAVVGESVGGNIAVNVAIRARDAGKLRPRAVIAVYPLASGDAATPSKVAFANAKPLNTAMLSWFTYYATQGPDATQDPHWDLTKADLRGLPPVTIVNAEIDPLRDDGAALEQALKAAGTSVERRVFPGVTHEFFGMGAAVRGAYDAELYVEDRLRPAFDIILPGEPGSFTKAPAK